MRRRVSPLLLSSAACLALCLVAPPAMAADEPVSVEAAWQDLGMLKKATKSRSTNEDLLQYLDAVFTAFKAIKKPDDPALLPKHEKEVAKYRKEAQKLILKILTLYKIKNENNVRDDVNTRAARILGAMGPILDGKGRKDLSKRIMQAIEKKMTKVKTHTINTEHLEAAFEALGKLNDPGTLQWMNKNYTHGNENQKEYLVAAHKSMVLFKEVPGKYRYEVVTQFVKMYSGIEAQAEQTSNDAKVQQKKRFWDEIKTYTIPVVQHFAGKPVDEEGGALAEMKQFQAWLRGYKNPKKAPWADPK